MSDGRVISARRYLSNGRSGQAPPRLDLVVDQNLTSVASLGSAFGNIACGPIFIACYQDEETVSTSFVKDARLMLLVTNASGALQRVETDEVLKGIELSDANFRG